MTTTKPHIRHNLTQEEKRRIAFEICKRVAHGELLSEIANEEGMPHPDTFRNWCMADPAIASAWQNSQDDRIEINMREILKVVDEDVPTYKDARGNVRLDPAATNRLRVRVKTRQWLISLLVSHRERQSHSHTEEGHPSSTSRQPTAPAQQPQHSFESSQGSSAPVFTPAPAAGRNEKAEMLVPMSRAEFHRFAALMDCEIDERGNPIPIVDTDVPGLEKPSHYPENLPAPSVK